MNYLLALMLAADIWTPARLVAELQNARVSESSGMAASRRNPGLFWTHNDSGSRPEIFLFDREGRDRGTWVLRGATLKDWEDMAAGPGPIPGEMYLYIGDIGDNSRVRPEIVVYRVPEPPAASPGRRTAPATAIRLRYPDGPYDAEALLVHPLTADIYIVTKRRTAAESVVFKAAAPHRSRGVQTLKRVALLNIPSQFDLPFLARQITGGSISPDGRSIALTDYFRAYIATAPSGAAFDEVWSQPLRPTDVGVRRQGEAITWSLDGRSLWLTSEGSPCPLYEVRRSR